MICGCGRMGHGRGGDSPGFLVCGWLVDHLGLFSFFFFLVRAV
jgi:hypothetical protein